MARDEDFTGYMSSRWSTLVRSAVLLGCSRDDAEDLVQTTLARCYTAWPKVAQADNRDAYVYRMLVNALTDSRRRRWWGERPTAELPETAELSDPLAEVDVSDAVERALAGLTTQQRAVLVLRYFAHLTEQQTAEALGIAPGTVKSRTSRALTAPADSAHLTDLPDGKTPPDPDVLPIPAWSHMECDRRMHGVGWSGPSGGRLVVCHLGRVFDARRLRLWRGKGIHRD